MFGDYSFETTARLPNTLLIIGNIFPTLLVLRLASSVAMPKMCDLFAFSYGRSYCYLGSSLLVFAR